MKKFVFRLDRVLKLRRQIEERIEIEFALKNSEYIAVKNEIERNKEELMLFISENSIIEGSFSIEEIQAADNYIFRLEKRIKDLKVELDEKKKELDRVRELLNEAKKARKILEKLREKRLNEYINAANREEVNELDDINQKLEFNKERLVVKNLPLEEI
ncbi:MAG: flagellar export protein FliJ [Spirochaetes bacterium]|nr:MAG: flagellar export protein FliJ [Spirochaetota bacterium]